MFLSLESMKKKKRNSEGERVPLTRSQSLQPARGGGSYPIVMHSPPLVVHTPECNRRASHNHNGTVITMLHDSPRRSIDKDQRSDSASTKRSNRRRSNASSDSGLRTDKRLSFDANSRRRQHKSPAPVDGARKRVKNTDDNSTLRRSSGILEGSGGSTDNEDESRKKKKQILTYFALLSKTQNGNVRIDMKKLESFISNGADVNATDKFGQFIMHEISRNWHPDVAKYLLNKGADIDHGDKYGRTPLHIAAAVGHTEMIEFLIQNKARINSRTTEEKQTPIHFAAKNNAVESLKLLIKYGANIHGRDYRARTPLYLAVENGRIEAAMYLLKIRAPAAVYDDQGVSCLSIMVQRMPSVAFIALQQFYIEDLSHRKLYCYLNYLENKLTSEEEQNISLKFLGKYERHREKREMSLVAMVSPQEIKKGDLVKSVLEKIVEHNEVRIIGHPAIKLLIAKKWYMCGRSSAYFGLFINILFAMIWSAIGVAAPITGEEFYRPFSAWWYVIVLEVLGVGMTFYFIVTHIMEDQIIKRRHNAYKAWRIVQAERDLKFCHPRWPEEKRHINECVENIQSRKQSRYFSNGWNLFDWFVYFLIFVVVVTRMLNVVLEKPKLKDYHIKIFSIVQIFIWLRILRRLRPFPTFGPFVIMLGYVARDTMKFLVLFLMFFIPYCCAFWMIFRVDVSKDNNQSPATYLEHIHDLIYIVFQMTVIGEFEWQEMKKKNIMMAQILTGTYMAIVSVVCISLYIAMLSNTFSRAYPQAKARALLIQAAKILFAERGMSKKRKLNMRAYLHEDCAPLVEDIQPQPISIATNITALGVEEFNQWKQTYENEADIVKSSLKELHSKQEHLLNHFQLILRNMDDEEDLLEEI